MTFPFPVVPPAVAPPSFVAESDNQASSGSSLSVAKPTGTADGDLLLAFVIAEDQIAGDMLPTGFTELWHPNDYGQTPNAGYRCGYKFAGGSEPANYSFTVSNGGGAHISTWRDAGTPGMYSCGQFAFTDVDLVFEALSNHALVLCTLADDTETKVPGANSGWDSTTSFDDSNEHGGWFAYAVNPSSDPTYDAHNPTGSMISAVVDIPPADTTVNTRDFALIGISCDLNGGSDITLPDDIESGDLIVHFDFAVSTGGLPTSVTPSGFTQIVSGSESAGSSSTRLIVSYKIADGTEGGTALTGMNSDAEIKQTAVYRKKGGISSVTVQDTAVEVTDGNPTSQTANASGGTTPLLVLGGAIGNSISDVNLSTNVRMNSGGPFMVHRYYDSGTPDDITFDADDATSDTALFSCYIELS